MTQLEAFIEAKKRWGSTAFASTEDYHRVISRSIASIGYQERDQHDNLVTFEWIALDGDFQKAFENAPLIKLSSMSPVELLDFEHETLARQSIFTTVRETQKKDVK